LNQGESEGLMREILLGIGFVVFVMLIFVMYGRLVSIIDERFFKIEGMLLEIQDKLN
jgi:hypothetical protein